MTTTSVIPPSHPAAQYYPAQIHPAGVDRFGAPVLAWEVVLLSDAGSFPQLLLSLPDGTSPSWLRRLSAEATGATQGTAQDAFSHGIEACWSPGRGVIAIEGRGTQQVVVFTVSDDFTTRANWRMVLEPEEGTELNSNQIGCFADRIMIRKRVYDHDESGFLSGHDHFFDYDGLWQGSRKITESFGERALGKVLDVRGPYFATASNERFETPTVFLWRVPAAAASEDSETVDGER